MIYYLNKQGIPVDPNGVPIQLVTEEPAAAEPGITNSQDDLTQIKGIGPARAKELVQYGIDSFQRLATRQFR